MIARSHAGRVSRVLALVAAVAGVLAIAQPGQPESEREPDPVNAVPLAQAVIDSLEGKKAEAESLRVRKEPATMPVRASRRRRTQVPGPDTTIKVAGDSAAEEALPARACFQ